MMEQIQHVIETLQAQGRYFDASVVRVAHMSHEEMINSRWADWRGMPDIKRRAVELITEVNHM